jgi:hypothetical protein
MHPLSPEQVSAASQLKTIRDELKIDLVLIGAMAYRTWIDDPRTAHPGYRFRWPWTSMSLAA